MILETKQMRLKMKIKEVEIDKFERKNEFLKYINRDCPFVSLTTKVEITNLVKYTKDYGRFYDCMSYLVMKAANNVKNFCYRHFDGKVWTCSEIGVAPVGIRENESIFFYHGKFTDTLQEFLVDIETSRNNNISNPELLEAGHEQDFWISCFPWRKISSLSVPFDTTFSNPQIIWDKYEEVDGKFFINIFVFANHAFVDGLHFAKFFDILETYEKQFPNI